MFGDFLFGGIAKDQAPMKETDKLKQKLTSVLRNEDLQILSSFELNQWATLTYHEGQHTAEEDLCEALFEALQAILIKPAEHTTLTLQKALVVARHVLLVGAERVMQEAQVIKPVVAALREYNTALLLQQQQPWYRFKGGAVDQGGPVRDEAEVVFRLLSLPKPALQQERAKHADPNSLVPVGNQREIAFATDEQRLHLLQRRMEQQVVMQQKSNLAKADNGFGGGYSSRDGKAVVGASHTLDEMMQMAQRLEASKQAHFSDDPAVAPNPNAAAAFGGRGGGFNDYRPPTATTTATTTTMSSSDAADLLDMGSTPQTTNTLDLLDLGEATPATTTTTTASSAQSDDLLSFGMTGLLGGSSETSWAGSTDPFATSQTVSSEPGNGPPPSQQQSEQNSSTLSGPQTKSSIFSSQSAPVDSDPFSAFDALAETNSSNNVVPPTTVLSNQMSATTQSLATLHVSGNSWSQSNPSSSNVPTISSTLTVSSMPKPTFDNDGGAFIMGGAATRTSSSMPSFPDDDGENAFVMGGAPGAGLEPLGSAPAAPPPPPPSFY